MAKRSRRKQNERKDFQKVKFKVGKKKPQGLNVTDTAFKSKGVTIIAQFQTSTAAVTSLRGLGIKEICSLLSHRVPGQRTFAFNELADYLSRYPEQMVDHLGDLLNAILPRLMDEDERNRSRCCQSLASIFHTLGKNSKSILEPFGTLIINYIICGLTHVNVAIATQSLQAVDLVTEFLVLKNSSDETAKLLKALMSMISSTQEQQKKKKTVIRLLSVGHLATKQARILVLVRILAVVEIACAVEEKKSLSEETVVWDVMEPKSFVLRSNLAVDLEPRPVVWPLFSLQSSSSVSASSATKNQSPLENLTLVLLHVIQFLSVYWPTVADQFGEGSITFEDLAGRRCCQDLLKSTLGFFRHLFLDEEKIDINAISHSFLEAIKTVTAQNPLTRKPVTTSKETAKGYYKHINKFVTLVLSRESGGGGGGGGSRGGFRTIDLLNRNALALLKSYRQFVVDSGGSQELISKLKHEVTKLERHLASIPDATQNKQRKRTFSEAAENIPLFDFSKNSKSASSEAVLLDHSYFAERTEETRDGLEDVPTPLLGEPDVIVF